MAKRMRAFKTLLSTRGLFLLGLREKGIIVPARFKDDEGRWRLDRSCGGHVAQKRIAKDIWATVRLVMGRGVGR